MPDVRITYVVQRWRCKKNGEPRAEGWRDWTVPFTEEHVAREVLAKAQGITEWMHGSARFRLVKVEERREVME